MLGYYDVFPEKKSTDLRVAIFENGEPDHSIPSGTHVFTEYYCNDLACDCQRMLIKCLYLADADSYLDEEATFSYTWNSDPDSNWMEILGTVDNPFLDPMHHQAPYAAELMEFWHDMYCRDDVYANRLELHYRELREKFGTHQGNPLIFRRDFANSAAPISESPADRSRRYKALRKSRNKRSKHNK